MVCEMAAPTHSMFRRRGWAAGLSFFADRGSNGHPQALGALLEGALSTFEDVAHVLPDDRVFEAAALIRNERQLARPVRSALRHDHLIRIGVHHQVGVVRHDDDLATPRSGSDAPALDRWTEGPSSLRADR